MLLLLQNVSQPRRQRQRQCRQTKGIIRRTMAVHERYKSLNIFCRPLQNNNLT